MQNAVSDKSFTFSQNKTKFIAYFSLFLWCPAIDLPDSQDQGQVNQVSSSPPVAEKFIPPSFSGFDL